MIIAVNKNLKKVAYDCVTKKTYKPLIVRVLSHTISTSVNFISVKYFTLTQTAIVIQISPLLIVVLASIFLGEKMSFSQLILLLVTFCGVILMIVGGTEEN